MGLHLQFTDNETVLTCGHKVQSAYFSSRTNMELVASVLQPHCSTLTC